MMKKVIAFPDKNTLFSLANSKGECGVYISTAPYCSKVYIVIDEDIIFGIDIDYQDVAFKFECFNINIERVTNFNQSEKQEIANINFDKIKLCIRYEWERPWLLEEGNTYNSDVIRETGEKTDIPETATSMCSSVVGLSFFDCKQNPILVIAQDEDSTIEMIVKNEKEYITSYLNKYECIDIKNLDLWVNNTE